MSAGRYNLQILQGKLYDKTFTWRIDGSLVNLTSYTARLKLLDDNGQVVKLLTTTLDGSGNGLILSGSAGTVEVIMKTALTATFTFNKGKYELELRRPDGEDLPFLAGNAYLTTEFVDP